MEEYHNPLLNAMNGGSGVPLNNEPFKPKEEKIMTSDNVDYVDDDNEDVKPKKGKRKKVIEDTVDMPDMGGLIDMPDIMVPDENYEDTGVIEDELEGAFNWAFIGTGQGGCRIVQSLYKLGYRRVCCINTTQQDLVNIDIPEENKFLMKMDDSGTAKNPEMGAKAVRAYREDVYDLMRRTWGTKFDRVLIISTLGGGSGSGSIETLIDISHDICQSFKIETGVAGEAVSVGALAALPKSNEGEKVNRNAYEGLKKLSDKVGLGNGKLDGRVLSPLIVVDNDKIHKMYPKLSVAKFWSVANQSITALFSLFNTISIQDSEYTTFDPAEYKDILQSGVVSFGACAVRKWSDVSDISFAIRDNLKKNILVSGLDLSKANVAACVFVAHPKVLEDIAQESLDHGVEMLTRIMGEGSVVHPGIFKGNVKDSEGNPSMMVYTFIGGLGEPEARLEEIARLGKIETNNRR